MKRASRERTGLVYIASILAVVAVAGLAFWLAGNVAGLVIIVALVGLLLYLGLGRERRGKVEVRSADDGVQRVLVVAHEGLGRDAIVDVLDARREAGPVEALIVVPALAGPIKRLTSDVDEEIAGAESELEEIVAAARRRGHATEGSIGDSDPRLALEDALQRYPADEVVVVNPPVAEMGSLESSATRRAVDDVPLPVTILRPDQPTLV
jgi:hypothetical protein